MTLVEFIAPVAKGKHQHRVLAMLFHRDQYEGLDGATVDEIRQALRQARIKGWAKINIADVLRKSGHLVNTVGLRENKRLWALTDSGRDAVREFLGLPFVPSEIQNDVKTLQNIVAQIANEEVRDYLNEALACLRANALRACVVFIWTAAIRSIHVKVFGENKKKLNLVIQKHDPKARDLKRIEDFAYLKDSTVLLAALDLGVLDKNEKDTLVEALNLRNRCGHPSKYKPGEKKVSAFVEDVTSIVFD